MHIEVPKGQQVEVQRKKALDGIHNELQTCKNVGRSAHFLLFCTLPLTCPYKISLSGAAWICLASLEQLELQMGRRIVGTDSQFDRLAEILKTKSIHKQETEQILHLNKNIRN